MMTIVIISDTLSLCQGEFFESGSVLNYLVQYGKVGLADERPGKEAGAMAEVSWRALTGEKAIQVAVKS